MIRWLASIDPCDLVQSDQLRRGVALATEKTIVFDFVGSAVKIGVAQSGKTIAVNVIRTIMEMIAPMPVEANLQLTWLFSGVSIELGALSGLLARWDETGEPPALSIIQLELGDARHFTKGLELFAGCELEIRFDGKSARRDAAINTGLLACHALIFGKLDAALVYSGYMGRPLTIEKRPSAANAAMVSIIMLSDRNGVGSH